MVNGSSQMLHSRFPQQAFHTVNTEFPISGWTVSSSWSMTGIRYSYNISKSKNRINAHLKEYLTGGDMNLY